MILTFSGHQQLVYFCLVDSWHILPLSNVIIRPPHCNGNLSPDKLGFDYVVTGNWVRAKWFAADGARPCGARGKVLRRSGQSLAASAANANKDWEI